MAIIAIIVITTLIDAKNALNNHVRSVMMDIIHFIMGENHQLANIHAKMVLIVIHQKTALVMIHIAFSVAQIKILAIYASLINTYKIINVLMLVLKSILQ